MKLRVIAGVILAAAVALAAAHVLRLKEANNLQATAAKMYLSTVNSYATTLFELAGERYASHEERGVRCIFSIQKSNGALPLVSRESGFTIVLLPARENDLEGLLLYASHYNEKVQRQADLLALSGDPERALVIYSLIKKYDRGPFLVEGLNRRIEIARRLRDPVHVESAKNALQEISFDAPRSVFDGVEKLLPGKEITK